MTPTGRPVGLRVVEATRHRSEHGELLMTDKTANKPSRRFARPAHKAAEFNSGSAAPSFQRPESKIALVSRMIERDAGASLDELLAATGWLPHTMRAALTGLKKKSHAITKEKVDGKTRYSIAKAPAQ